MQIRRITGKDNALIKKYVLSINDKNTKNKAVSYAKNLKGRKAIGFFENDELDGWLSYDDALIYEWVSENSSYEPLVEIVMKSLGLGVPIDDVVTKINSTLETIELPDFVEEPPVSNHAETAEHNELANEEGEGSEGDDNEENHVSEEYLSQFEDADLNYDYYKDIAEKQEKSVAKAEPEVEIEETSEAHEETEPESYANSASAILLENGIPDNSSNERPASETPEIILPQATMPDNTLNYVPYAQDTTPQPNYNEQVFTPLTADYTSPMSSSPYEQLSANPSADEDYDPFLDEMMMAQPTTPPFTSQPLIPEDFDQSPFFNQNTVDFTMPETRSDIGTYQNNDMIDSDFNEVPTETGRKKKFLFSEEKIKNSPNEQVEQQNLNNDFNNPSLDSLMDDNNEEAGKTGILKFNKTKNKDKSNSGGNKPSPIIIIVGAILLAIAVGFGGYMLFNKLTAPKPVYDGTGEVEYTGEKHQISENESVELVIEPADTLFEVKEKMYQIGLSSIADEIYSLCQEYGSINAIKAGTYIIYGNETGEAVAKRIMSGETVPQGIVGVNHGDTLQNIAAAIDEDKLPFTGADFLAETSNLAGYTSQYKMFQGIEIPSLEGYIPSGVYDLREADKPADAVTIMLNMAEKQYEDSGLSPQEYFKTLTIASMIEKEYGFEEDAYDISSVIKNRLNNGMRLEIDATVKYALGTDKQQVMYSDLEVDSPYNTYQVDGLPVGPICSGISPTAFDAALHPKQTEYLYYVLSDKEGHHAFSETAEQFEKDKQKYLELYGLTE